MVQPKPCFEDPAGHDGVPMTVRSALQQVELAGLVDYELAGHSCARPAAVCQNQDEEDRPASDFKLESLNSKGIIEFIMFQLFYFLVQFMAIRFDIQLKEDSCMIWKPSAVQLRNVKSSNCASYFDASQILQSPAVNQAHSQDSQHYAARD